MGQYFDEMSAGNSKPEGKNTVADARHTNTHSTHKTTSNVVVLIIFELKHIST